MSVVSRQRIHRSGVHRPPLQFKQLELRFEPCDRPLRSPRRHGLVPCRGELPRARTEESPAGAGPRLQGRDLILEAKAGELLRTNGAPEIAHLVRVEWNSRLQTAAGRADYKAKLISLNPRLQEHGANEIDRTLQHELAHFLAQFRAGRRRILPHGPEWRDACRDLGIAHEARCHNLPFPTSQRARRFFYKCPNCQLDFPRARRIRRIIACLACCRAHNRGKFDARFRLRLVAASL